MLHAAHHKLYHFINKAYSRRYINLLQASKNSFLLGNADTTSAWITVGQHSRGVCTTLFYEILKFSLRRLPIMKGKKKHSPCNAEFLITNEGKIKYVLLQHESNIIINEKIFTQCTDHECNTAGAG